MTSEQRQNNEHKENPEQAAPNPTWDGVRYLVILGLIGFGIWYYFFNKPVHSVSQHIIGKTMGTDYQVKVADFPETGNWPALCEEVQKRLDAVDGMMSTYKSDSEVSRFNAFESTEDWFDVSAETAKVVSLALEISRLTGGAFDITVGPLVDLWGFGPKTGIGSETELIEKMNEIKSSVGFDKLEVRLDPPGLKKSVPGLKIDLSAIAKGYAVDAVAELLEEKKSSNYMIEIGGEVRCRGNKGNLGDWTVGIEKPLIVPPGVLPGRQCKLPLGDMSLATSGDYLNYRSIGGVRYSHILDPRSGFPTERIAKGEAEPAERVGSVAVLDPSCARADALATSMFVLGEKAGLKLAEEKRIPVLFLIRTDAKDRPIREAASSTFPKTTK